MATDPHAITHIDGARLVGGPSGGGEEGENDVGELFYVNNDTSNLLVGAEVGADVNGFGQTPLQPFSTIDFAIGQCAAGRGDKIKVLPGHAETLTAVITLDVQGVTIEGQGRGANRPAISSATASIDLFTVTASDCKIENLLFNEVTDAVDSLINVAAADCVIEDCQFDVGASNTNPCITHASGARLKLLNNDIRVTANGPAEFYSAETAVDGCEIKDNLFDGGSSANSFDDAHIDLGSLVVTDMIVEDNIFLYGTALVGTADALVNMSNNKFGGLCIPKAGVPLEIYCDASGTTAGEGTKEDPTTLTDAINTKSAAGSRILLYPGTYTVTADLLLNTADMVVEPVDYQRGMQNVSITSATDGGGIFVVSATGCSVRGLRLTHTGTETSENFMVEVATGGSQFSLLDCVLDHAAIANVGGISIATGLSDCLVRDCKFILPASGETCINHAGAQTHIDECSFDLSGGVGVAIAQAASPGAGTIISHCNFSADGTTTPMMTWDGTSGAGHMVYENRVFDQAGTTAVFGDDTDLDTQFISNWQGSVAGAEVAIDPSVS